MKCPVCNVDLVMTDRQGIEIDYCSKCRGVWLDRGELDKIIERASEVVQQKQPPPQQTQQPMYQQPQQKYYGDDYYKHKKRKSILGEIFDF